MSFIRHWWRRYQPLLLTPKPVCLPHLKYKGWGGGGGGGCCKVSRQLEYVIFFSGFPFFLSVKNRSYPKFYLSGHTTRVRPRREKLYQWQVKSWSRVAVLLKAGFRSRSLKRSRMSAYDLVKIKTQSRNRSHKRDEIGVRRIRTVPFLPTPLTTPSLTFRLWSSETRLSESNAETGKDKPITIHVPTLCDWFSSSASACDCDDLVFTWS